MSISSEIQRINTNIANAYTQAGNKGATLPQVQNSANLAETISSIQTGGGTPVSVEEKDVNFYDYDGTRLYSYTLAEVQALTELPELPSHDGLICQGWNWSLADIKAENKETDVGAMYVTDDGKTRLYIEVPTNARTTVPLCFRQSVANGVEVDWGDGSAVETFSRSGSTNILPTHTYSSVGNYVITLKPIGNCQLTLGDINSVYCIMGINNATNKVYQNMLYKVEIGTNVTTIGNKVFISCRRLSTITIPNSVTIIGTDMFSGCYSLSTIIIPNSVTSIETQAFISCNSLSIISIPKSVTSIGNSAFSNCGCLLSITLPNSVTSIGTGVFISGYGLSSIAISNNLTSIETSTFYNCMCLSIIVIPNSVTSIGSRAFGFCYGMHYYDFSTHTSIPTLVNTDAFNSIPTDCKIVVPDNLYETWIGTTNWSTYASYIIKKSDWDAL